VEECLNSIDKGKTFLRKEHVAMPLYLPHFSHLPAWGQIRSCAVRDR